MDSPNPNCVSASWTKENVVEDAEAGVVVVRRKESGPRWWVEACLYVEIAGGSAGGSGGGVWVVVVVVVVSIFCFLEGGGVDMVVKERSTIAGRRCRRSTLAVRRSSKQARE